MNLSRLTVVMVGVCSFGSSSIAWIPTDSTQSLLDENPGLRAMFAGERMVALYGVPFATDSDQRSSTDEFVEGFLGDHGDALGVDDVVLGLRDKINIRNDKFTVYTYTQKVEGLPVHGSVVKIPVLLGATEKIGYIGIRLVQNPHSPLPGDLVSPAGALFAVQQSAAYGHLTDFTTPDKVIYEAFDETLHRAWCFSGYDDDESWLFFVDTNSGEIVGVEDQVFHEPQCNTWAMWGRADGWATPGVAADSDANPPMPGNLPGVLVSIVEGDDPGCPSDEGTILAQQFTDENGEYLLGGFLGPVRVTSPLVGEWVTVVAEQGDDLLECEEVGPGCLPSDPVDLWFNAPSCEEFDTAQVNAFLVVEKTHNWFKALQPTFTGIDHNLLTIANVDMPSAYYHPAAELIALGTAGPCYNPISGELDLICNNWGFSTIISHEYGHYIEDRLMPMPYCSRAFLEGAADTVAALAWDTEYGALGLYHEPGPPFLRNLDEPDIRFNDCSSLPDWCSDCTDGHCLGLALGGAFWDLRGMIGLQTTSELFADFMLITDGEWDRSIPVEVLIVDDNDMDLSNGTPHQYQIVNSFISVHVWPDPVAQGDGVVVKWIGPLVPPIEGEDYFVYYETVPPNVALVTTEKDGVGVERWFIGRGTEEDPQDLGTVYADWDGRPHNVIVEVGSPADPEINCRNLNIVDIPAQRDLNWSSVELNVTGTLARAQSYANDTGDGGRISGTVGQRASRVFGKGIGRGASDIGTFRSQDLLHKLQVETIPSGSELIAYRLLDKVEITGELQGSIEVVLIADNSVSSNGKIHVQGTGVSTGDITVTGSEGSGLRGAEILIEGPYAGTMTIASTSSLNATPPPRIGTGELHGAILIHEDLMGSLTVTGTGLSTGYIHVDRDIYGDMVINGDMSGDILADADGDEEGSIWEFASITINGEFNGDICAANLSPGVIPPGLDINITFGPSGTVCGEAPSP